MLRSGGYLALREWGPVVSRETGKDASEEVEPSKAIQSSKEECDINVIVRRFGVTGQMPMTQRMPEYGDFSGIFDFQSAMNAVRRAEEMFMELPSEIRDRFGNDPGKFVEFAQDEKNLPEMRKMGLAKPEEVVHNVPASDVPTKETTSASRSGKRAGKVADPVEGSEGSSGGE